MTLRSALRSLLRGSPGRPDATPLGASDPAPEDPEHAWGATAPPPWRRMQPPTAGVRCIVCGWEGERYGGVAHCESADCPRCGSIGRDRFLVHSLCTAVEHRPGLRLLETSPRMGAGYRTAMARWFTYTSSDFDERAHKGAIQLDLQAMDLPDASLDVLMTAHVLEHVPDTDRALDEMHRVLAPGGQLILQVPVLQARTAPPDEPEFHGDDTPVFWRFGHDLTARLRDRGFDTELLCTQELYDLVAAGATAWPGESSPEFDADGVVAGAILDDLRPSVSGRSAEALGLQPAYMYLTWTGRRT